MAEWSANAQQTVNPGETVIFTENPLEHMWSQPEVTLLLSLTVTTMTHLIQAARYR